tara:strand:- start:175825 stop:176991 length:1167 start_codon:yes stop_codon:yes gene_type:complete
MPFGRTKTKTVALIDIGSLSLGGAYAVLNKGEAPHICYSTRIPLPVTDEATPRELLRILDEGLTKLTHKLEHEGSAALSRSCGVRHVDDVVVSVGSPWQRTQLRSHTEKFPGGKRISAKDIEDAKEKIEGALGIDPATSMLVDHSIIEVLVNGYQTAKPFGKRAQRMSVLGLASVIPISVHDRITSHLSKTFHVEPIKMQSAPALSYVVMRDLFVHEPDFLAAIVTGEATDLLLVKKGILTGVATALEGVHSITRAVKKAVPAVPAEEVGDLVKSGMLHPTTVDTVKGAQREAKSEWASAVISSLADLARKYALPQTFFILSDFSCRETFEEIMTRQDVHALRLGDHPFTVIGLKSQNLTDHVVFMGESDRDLFHGLLALFYSKKVEW